MYVFCVCLCTQCTASSKPGSSSGWETPHHIKYSKTDPHIAIASSRLPPRAQLSPASASARSLWSSRWTPWWSFSAWVARSCWTAPWSGSRPSGSPGACVPSQTAAWSSPRSRWAGSASDTPRSPRAARAGRSCRRRGRDGGGTGAETPKTLGMFYSFNPKWLLKNECQ